MREADEVEYVCGGHCDGGNCDDPSQAKDDNAGSAILFDYCANDTKENVNPDARPETEPESKTQVQRAEKPES